MIEHKFYQLAWKVRGGIAFLTWLPTSANMSKDDFSEHFKTLNSFICAYNTSILFIDAIDFTAKIEKSIIKELLNIKEPCSLKWIIYTSSNKRLKRLFQKLEPEIKLIEHASRDKLLEVYSELTSN